mgnify:CR=1 FL=1
MEDSARDRLREIASLSAYASERGLGITPLFDRTGDGGLISLTVTRRPEEITAGSPVYVSIHFGARSQRARFLQHYEQHDGTHEHVAHEVPFDFSDSFRVGDAWADERERGADPPTVEFGDAESLVDFLADRLEDAL